MSRRRAIAASGVAVAIAAGAWLATGIGADASTSNDATSGSVPRPTTTTDDSSSDGTDGSVVSGERAAVTVVRDDLTTEYEATAQVSYGDEWALPLELTGITTGSRDTGTVLDFGDEIVRVDNQPVYLAEGAIPMYRELSLVNDHLTGYDVAFVQRFLIDAGFDDDGDMVMDGEFGTSTRNALRDWQDSVGLDDTGRIGPDTLVLSPEPLRVESAPRVGTRFDAITVTAAEPEIALDLDSSDRSSLPVGADVEVEVADGTTIAGQVASQERTVDSDGAVSYHTVLTPATPLGPDESSVVVRRDIVEAADVLVVPTSALLAVAEGGFALEVVAAGGSTHLVPVEVGAVVEARAEVTGAVQEGDQVVIAE